MLNILIVGAGPTGLTAAIELARRGVLATVIDKRSAPLGLSRAVLIHPATIASFQPSGIADRLREAAVEIPAISVFRKGRLMGRLMLNKLSNPAECLYGIPQDRVETLLIEAFENLGGKIQFNTRCSALSQDSDHVEIYLNGEKKTFDYVIGADGVRSFVRSAIGLEFDGFELPDFWTVADVSAPKMDTPAEAKIFIQPDGKTAIVVPMGQGRYRITSNIEDSADNLPISDTFSNVENVGTFRVAIRQVSRYSVGRVFLVGDAAHSHSPIDGRGLNLGVADAVDLADRMINGDLEGYSVTRLKAGKYVIKLSEYARGTATCKRRTPRFKVFLATKIAHHIWFVNRIAARLALRNTPLTLGFGKQKPRKKP